MSLIEQLQADCDYDPEADSPVDNLIAYKDALEDLLGRVDELALANAGDPPAERYRERHGLSTISAADVTGGLFSMGFGNAPEEATA